MHTFPPQEIRDVDLANVPDMCMPGDELLELGNRLHVDTQRLEPAQDLEPSLPSQGRYGEQDPVDVEFLDQSRQPLGRMHLDAVDQTSMQRLGVVDEHQRIESPGGGQNIRQSCTGITRPIDGDPGHRRLQVVPQQVIPDDESRTGHVDQAEAGKDHHVPPAERRDVEPPAGDTQNQAVQKHGRGNGEHGLVAKKTNHRPVQAGADEDGETDHFDGEISRPIAGAKTENPIGESEGNPKNQRHHQCVGHEGNRPLHGSRQLQCLLQIPFAPFGARRNQVNLPVANNRRKPARQDQFA